MSAVDANSLITDLRGIVAADRVILPADSGFEKYEHDETEDLRFSPHVVVLPDTTQEVQEIVRLAERRGVPLVSRAALPVPSRSEWIIVRLPLGLSDQLLEVIVAQQAPEPRVAGFHGHRLCHVH